MTAKPSQEIVLYAHAACWMVGPVQNVLEDSGVAFRYVDIHQDSAGRERVRQINRGYESVPTLVFADGSTLTEPSTGELKAKLVQQGLMEAEPGVVERVKKVFGKDPPQSARED